MARNQSPPISIRRARVGAALCLLAVLLGPAQVLPGLLAVGAALEGSHSVKVGSDGAEFHLVLSHERGQAGRPDYNPRHHPQHPAHRHGLAAGVLCFLGDRSAMEPDHVANFATGSACEKISQSSALEGKAADLETLMPSVTAAASTVMRCVTLRLLLHQNHGPPGMTDLPRMLRSTVLLV
jgi:hypothetical protein